MKNAVHVMALGDVMLSRDVGRMIARHGAGFPFAQIKDYLAQGDIVLGVLSAPITLSETVNPLKPQGYPVLKSHPECVEGLAASGFKLMHVGNNHVLDYGVQGLEDTLRYLRGAGIEAFGAGMDLAGARKPAVLTVNDQKIGFLGYCESYPASESSPGCAPLRPDVIRQDIEALRDAVDVLVVSVHHGIEYSYFPYPQQRQLARQAIDWGADAVIGHHPHVWQGYERYGRGVIFHSLGNFVFDRDDKTADGMSGLRRRLVDEGRISAPGGAAFYESAAVSLFFDRNKGIDVEITPVVIGQHHQPELAQRERRQEILDFISRISQGLSETDGKLGRDLSALYAHESVEDALRRSPLEYLKKLHRLKPRHLKLIGQYFLSLRISS
jgi:poly-gamma-glutamate capsule biosynthesis protein CapA/YwtB (metallophosphatase superfamily)